MAQETASKRDVGKNYFPVLAALLCLLTGVGTIFAYFMVDNPSKSMGYFLTAAFVLTGFFLFFLVVQCRNQVRTLTECGILALCYGLGYFILILSVRYSTLFFLAIGPVLASMLFSFPIGFMMEVIVGILFCAFCGYAPEQALVLFLSGAVICMLSRFFKKKSTYRYGLVVVVAVHVILMVAMNQFVLFRKAGAGVLYSALCSIVTVGICNSLYIVLRSYIKNSEVETGRVEFETAGIGMESVELEEEPISAVTKLRKLAEKPNRSIPKKNLPTAKEETGKVILEPVNVIKDAGKVIVEPIRTLPEPVKLEPTTAVTDHSKMKAELTEFVPEPVKPLEVKRESETRKEAEAKRTAELKESMEQALDRLFPQEEKKETIAPESKLNDVRFQLIKVLFPENILMEQLRDRSPRLFLHSQKIGNISYDAAKSIGANSLLAKAGGYYHEIGRLTEGNYITEGIRLAEEQNFPDSVIQIIKQHNVKISNPTSPEAAIVMITDSIVSTAEYVKHAPENKRVSVDKIINNIFTVRMKNGTLDEAGITPDQMQVLTKFYLDYFEHASGI